MDVILHILNKIILNTKHMEACQPTLYLSTVSNDL